MTRWLHASLHWLRRAAYRTQQFLASLRPWVSTAEQAELARWLPPLQPDLAAAALLHDAAKTALPGRHLRLHHRVMAVLMEAMRPGWVQQAARNEPRSWRYPFYLHVNHPELSARLAEQAGCAPLTVELIRRHQEKLTHAPRDETERLLALLQAADDAS